MERHQRRQRVKFKGKALDIVRELYLRNDIPCSIALCDKCNNNNNNGAQKNILPAYLTHYLMPFPDVVLNYLEILEFPEIQGVIFSQTVIQVLQSEGGKRLLNKLRSLIQGNRQKCILFTNEFSLDTCCHRKDGESLPAWRTRSTYHMAVWYYNHLEGRVPIVMVTEDQEIIQTYEHETSGVLLVTLENYLKEFFPNLSTAHDIYDSLSALLKHGPISDQVTEYEEYLPNEVLESGLKAGRFFQGSLKVSEYHYREEAFVVTQSVDKDILEGKDILIKGKKNRNRAVHGDIVVVKLLPRSEWRSRSRTLQRQDDDGDEDSNNDSGSTSSLLPSGKIVGIIQRRWRDYVASFAKDENFSSRNTRDYVLVIPYDCCIPKIRILTRQAATLKDDRIVVRIDSWEFTSQYPNGHFVRSLGKIDKVETETAVLLVEHGISVNGPSGGVLQEMPSNTEENPWKVDSQEVAKRKDLRHTHLICSIDPKGCEDVDDTLSIKWLPNGTLEVGVHIADVTHFVPYNSLTDQQARAKGTTFYMTEQRYDMLPRVLSAEVCSLIENVDRYAVSVLWTLDNNYEVIDAWFGRTVIRSSYKLDYELAQEIIESTDDTFSTVMENISALQTYSSKEKLKRYQRLRKALLKLTEISQVLKVRRLRDGALELENCEVQFEFEDRSSGVVEDIKPHKDLLIHETVSELMVFTNCWVAKKILDFFPSHALLRNHSSPRQESFGDIALCAEVKGFKIDSSSNKNLAKSLDRCVDPDDPLVNMLLRNITVHAMTQALYFSTGSVSPELYCHYGLAVDHYTHFTSPIRRYADVLVHRQLLAIAEGKLDRDGVLSNTVLQELCDHINQQNRVGVHHLDLGHSTAPVWSCCKNRMSLWRRQAH